MFAIGRTTVRRCRKVTAAVYLLVQGMLLQSMFFIREALRRPPASDVDDRSARVYGCSSVAWDETSENVILGIDKSLTVSQQLCSWQVMVATSVITASIVPRDSSQPCSGDTLVCVRPPVALTGTSAPCMWHALFCTPLSEPFERACGRLDNFADVSARCYICDGASSNKRLVYHACRNIHKRTLTALKLCDLHDAKIVQTSAASLLGNDLTS